MVMVCTYNVVYDPVQQRPSNSKRWFISISISFCSFVIYVCPNLSLRMAACFKRKKKKEERRKERKIDRKIDKKKEGQRERKKEKGTKESRKDRRKTKTK